MNGPMTIIENTVGLFNKCMDRAEFQRISSIYMKVNRKDCGSYRGINVLASMDNVEMGIY